MPFMAGSSDWCDDEEPAAGGSVPPKLDLAVSGQRSRLKSQGRDFSRPLWSPRASAQSLSVMAWVKAPSGSLVMAAFSPPEEASSVSTVWR